MVVTAPQKEVIANLGQLLDLKTIYFDLDKYNIRPDAETELDKIVKVMNDNSGITVELSSYCDCRESKAYNQKLSDNRANATANYIKTRITNPERIYGKGYGKTHLVNGCACDDNVGSNCTDAEHQVNRRTEFLIVKK
jgi:outer membrane protein OmpA-like peptidoglycan-associated protein